MIAIITIDTVILMIAIITIDTVIHDGKSTATVVDGLLHVGRDAPTSSSSSSSSSYYYY